jgi:RHH-type rel operon transcriptional repressor/antitoxin RelB
MAATTTLTVRLSPETKDKLDALAQSTRRSKAFLAAEAIDDYVAANAWQVEAIGEALAAADAGGPFHAHDEVMGYLERRGRGERPKRPKPSRHG